MYDEFNKLFNNLYTICRIQFGFEFSSFKYKNRSLKTYKIISGRIDMSNYSFPFDFDGDRFLFLDYHTKDSRKICIYYTLSDKEMYEYKISKDYGHISHMKNIMKKIKYFFVGIVINVKYI